MLAVCKQSLTGLKSKEVESPPDSALEKHGCEESGARVFNVSWAILGHTEKQNWWLKSTWALDGVRKALLTQEKAGNRGVGAVGLRFGYEQTELPVGAPHFLQEAETWSPKGVGGLEGKTCGITGLCVVWACFKVGAQQFGSQETAQFGQVSPDLFICFGRTPKGMRSNSGHCG